MHAFAFNAAAHFPGIESPKTYAAFPVWKDSARATIKFSPLSKRAAAKLYHDARRFERSTRAAGMQDGAIGRNGLLVLHALVFDCLNYSSGRLDPCYATIARLACISGSSVYRGLKKLQAAGVLHWVRRCVEGMIDGRYTLAQISNAYGIAPSSCWRGYRAPPAAPAPDPASWGASPPLPGAAVPVALAAAIERLAAYRAKARPKNPGLPE